MTLRARKQYAEAAFADIPPYNSHPWCKNEDSPGESPPPGPLRDRYIGYYAAVSEIDHNIGRILARGRDGTAGEHHRRLHRRTTAARWVTTASGAKATARGRSTCTRHRCASR
ncbi:MAG: hypothetical protein R2838_12585 [Caldilineaceae bacterium]